MYRRDQEFLKDTLITIRRLFYTPGFRPYVSSSVIMLGILVAILLSIRTSQEEFENRMAKKQDSLMQLSKIEIKLFELIKHDILGDYAKAIPDTINFLGGPVYLNEQPERGILNMLFTFLLGSKENKRYTVSVLQNHYFYEPHILDTLKAFGLHKDFGYLIMPESGAYYNAVSPTGPVGLAQFIKATAYEYGLEINEYCDMRRDPLLATKAMSNYLSDLKAGVIKLRLKLNSDDMALRAYNAGLRKILEAAARQSWVEKPWFLDVNDENNLYWFWSMAYKILYEDSESFGLSLDYDYKPMEFKVIKVKMAAGVGIDFLELAELFNTPGVSSIILKYLNPAYIGLNKKGNRILYGNPRRSIIRDLRVPLRADVDRLKKAKIKGVQFILN